LPHIATNARLLASDLDGTLIAPPGTPEGSKGVDTFRARVSATKLRLAYVTGRHLALTLAGVREAGLPRPEALACDVGTTLYWDRGGEFVPDRDYEESIRVGDGVIPAREVRSILADLASLALQEPSRQAEFKVSYVSERPLSRDLVAEIDERLAARGGARLVVSVDSETGEGLLDVLPEGVGKATAVTWLRERLDLAEPFIVYAGDSGNDLDALLLPSPGIVVANTPESLRAELRTEAERLGTTDRIYFAPSPFATGVVEGLRHFGV
jgi:sucrose-6-phosphatase